MNMERTTKCLSTFDAENLKKIRLMKSSKGNFCIKITTLDRDSLQVRIFTSYMKESSLSMVSRLYIGGFFDLNELVFIDPFKAVQEV